jgi:GNAT superfamily N-acetyltransferase
VVVRTRTARPDEIGRIAEFCQAEGYRPAIRPGDLVVLATEGDELCGALRLCEEGGVLVLRGMRVAEPLRRQGIGTQLLSAAEPLIGGRACFCIAHRYLEPFYGRVGFSPADEGQSPSFLRERCAAYQRDDGLDVVILRRPRRAAPAHELLTGHRVSGSPVRAGSKP